MAHFLRAQQCGHRERRHVRRLGTRPVFRRWCWFRLGSDRQQNAMTQQGRDIGTMLELLGGQQQAASGAAEAAHGAARHAQSTAAVATDLLKPVRQLEADVADLQSKLRSEDAP
jgi:hypothetical protein